MLAVIGTVVLHKYKANLLKYISTYAFRPVGIGGWLMLPIFGFGYAVVMITYDFGTLLSVPGFIGLLVESNVPWGFRRALFVSIGFSCAVMLSAVLSLYFIFWLKSGVRQIATTHYVLLALASIIDIWAVGVLRSYIPSFPVEDKGITTAGGAIVGAVIWIQYFQMSKRVRNTFGNRGEPPISGSKAGAL